MPADSSSDQIPSTPTSSSRLDSKGRELIDETTLARLLDECKQEQEQLQMIEIAQSEHDSTSGRDGADSILGGRS